MSSSSSRRDLQRLWLDARCASVGAVGQAEKMSSFLSSFLSQFATRRVAEFQRVFGKGNDVAQLVCKTFSYEANATMRQGGNTTPAKSAAYLHLLSSTLVILVGGFAVEEITYFAPLYELLADSLIITTSLALYRHLAECPTPPNATLTDSPSSDSVALECLKLVTQILACPHEGLVRRCSLEAAQPTNVSEVCRVLTSSITTPHCMRDAECSLAQAYVRRIASLAAPKTLENALTDLEESLVICNCPPPPPSASLAERDTYRSGFAVSLACLMETIILLYKTLDRPFRDHFSFGAFASSMISADDILEVHPKCLSRIVTCIETIATSPVYGEQSTSTASPMRQGLLKLVPGTIQTLKQKLAMATALTSPKGTDNESGVSCPEAFECLVTLFICSTQPVTAKYYGESVLKLLQLPDASGSLADFFLRSGIESMRSLQAQQLAVLFDTALALSTSSSPSSPTRQIVSVFIVGVVQVLARRSLTTVERRSLAIDFLTTVSETSQVCKAIVLHEGALGASLTGIVETLQASRTEGAALLSKASILSKVVVDGPDCAADLSAQRYPGQVIECMLACYYAQDLSGATIVLRDMLTNIVSKTGHFFTPLIAALAVATQGRPWRQETSLLLATFASILQRGKHAEKAVDSNAVELLLTLLCQVSASTTPNLDVHLIGTALAFLFRPLRFSDVWVLFDATVASLSADRVLVQMVADLCCGFFHTSTALRRCYAVFDGAAAAGQNFEVLERDHHVSFGPYQVPVKPFVELDYPLRALVGWCTASVARADGESVDAALADLVEFLFASSPRRFDNDIIVPFIKYRQCTKLLNKVDNVADSRLDALWAAPQHRSNAPYPEAAAEIGARQAAWGVALLPSVVGTGAADKSQGVSPTPDPSRVIQLGEGGGISGVVACGEEHWPSRDGYSTAVWVRWRASRDKSTGTQGAAATLPLWRLSWTHNRKTYGIKLQISPTEQCAVFSCEGGGSVSTVRTPAHAVKPNVWQYIVLVHDRSSFNASEAAIFVDGQRVATALCSFPAPSWQPSLQKAVLGSAQAVEMSCSIGSTLDRPTKGVIFDLTSWKVFNQALSVDEITSLYCCGAQPVGGVVWSPRTGQVEFPLEMPSYPAAMVQGLEICAQTGRVPDGSSGSSAMLTMSTPTSHLVIDVDARSLAPHDNDETHFQSQVWSLHNSTSTSAGVSAVLSLHGAWSAGAVESDSSSDAVTAFFAHGGMRDVRRWMHWLRQPLPTPSQARLRDAVARNLVHVMTLVQHQSILAHSTWGDLLVDLADTVTAVPAAFFGPDIEQPERVAEQLLSLCVSSVRLAEGRSVPLVHSTVLLEHLFFNWQVLVSVNVVSLMAVMDVFVSLLERSNPFAALNAQRFRQANFEDGFVYGLFMEWVPPFILQASVGIVGLFLRSIVANTEEPTSSLLTLCALSVPNANGECRLASQMVLACPSYVALVRNLLLRVLHEICDEAVAGTECGQPVPNVSTTATSTSTCTLEATSTPSPSRATASPALIDQLCDLLPPCWFLQMMSPASHPVTVTLTCRLFVLCVHRSSTFRHRHAEAGSVCFEAALSHFAHQEDILTLLLDGFAGRVQPLLGSPGAESRGRPSVGGPSEWDTTNARQRYEALLVLALCMLKAQSEALLTDQFALYSPPTCFTSYFSQFAMQASRTCARVAKLRRCCLAVLFCVRLSHRGRGAILMDPTSLTSPTEVARVSNTGLRRLLARLMAQTVQRVAAAYDATPTLRAVLYSQNAAVNWLDLLMWPILSSVRVTDLVDAAETGFVPLNLGQSEDLRAPPHEESMSDDASITSLSHADNSVPGTSNRACDADTVAIVSTTKAGPSSLPCLDALVPKDQMEAVFEASRHMFLAHARQYVRQADSISATASKTTLGGFVLALHRALMAQPVASGTQTESLRAAFLSAVWLRAAELAMGTSLNDPSPSSSASRNVMAVGKYMLSRLVAGLPVPPETLARHFRTVLTRFERQKELVRFARTALFEWFMFVVNKSYFQTDSAVASSVVSMVSSTCDVLLHHTFPTAEMAQLVALRLIELTLVVMTDVGTPADGVGKKVCVLWAAYLNAHQQSPSLSFLYVGDGAADAWLLAPSATSVAPVECPTWECFTRWFRRFHTGFLQILRAQPLHFVFTLAEPQSHLRLVRISKEERGDELRRLMRRCAEDAQTAATEWLSFQSTATVVDPVFCSVSASTNDDADDCGKAAAAPDGATGGSWTVFSNGEVSRLAVSPQTSARNGWPQQPLRRFLRYTPPPCVPICAALKDTKAGPCKLYRNAVKLLTRIASVDMPASPLWVGNIYHIVGIEAHISTLVLTERELLIIRCSQVTPNGDFFIARIQPHTASTQQSRKLKESTIYSTLRRFLPGHNTSRGGATQSAAAFRFSQYYRQLRSDVSGAESATVYRVPLASLAEAHERLFLHLPAAMEFILESGERLLVVVLDEELSFSRPALQSLVQAIQERVECVSVDTMAAKRARLAQATRQWTTREMSNRQYLAVLNDSASRTEADLSQYPVMPWVLADYQSDVLTLSNPSIYRPLGTPVGALDPARARHLQERFRDWVVESGEPPFHFGTHYSTSAIVMYYLVRLEPLTTWAKRFQGGKLDMPDRLFHSIAEAWESSSGNNSGDVKELIPEFFSMAAFLYNRNDVALGVRRDGTRMGDVLLPPWALNTPHRFVHFNCVALESECVSTHLNEWIDLIFGFKQQGEEAAKAVNVFSYTSYRDGVESAINRAATEEERKSIVASVDNFGQTPPQLFSGHAPHPPRASAEACPTTQQYLLQRVSELKIGSRNAAAPVGSRTYAVNQLVVLSTQQLLSCGWLETASTDRVDGSPQLFIYDTCRDTVQCYLQRPTRLLATTPTIESLGCGQYAAMCTTSSGHLLFVGTSSGVVVAFRRKHARDTYTLSSLLPLNSNEKSARNRVVGLQLCENRRLFVYHERECLLQCWCLSQLGGTLAFATHLVTSSDDSPVVHCAFLTHHHVVIAVKSQSLCLLAADGTVLTMVALDAIETRTVSMVSDTPPLTAAPITAVCVFNCQSFDTQNLLFLGHADGTLTTILLESSHESTETAALFTFTHIRSIAIDVAVTCLCAIETISAVAVGGADGKTRLVRFPFVDSSDSD